jgi:uncharacterized 2Fe-2S/4Fe-4S cluster protein (DUF4445 family)
MLVKLEDLSTITLEQPERFASLADALRESGLFLDLRCSGEGICGKCEILLEHGHFQLENEIINIRSGHPRTVKSCRVKALSQDGVIFVPAKSLVNSAKIQSSHQYKVKAFHADAAMSGLAVAIDIGTTTVAVALLDAMHGEIIGSASNYNHQICYGDNVISRISYASESPENLLELQRCVIEETINPLLRKVCLDAGREQSEIKQVSVAANTVMTHLFLGISPASIGVMPFEPEMKIFPAVKAEILNLAVAPDAIVRAVPAASGYIGGDIVAGVVVSGISELTGVAALLDIGTNCETVLFDGKKLFSCASAAGPAFEGAGIGCGCRAMAGAIEHISFDHRLDYQLAVIGNIKPTGICGSAMIDFIANGRDCGLINELGRFDVELLKRTGNLINLNDGIIACRISSSPDIYISEKDLEQILKAKAAVYSGLQTLCGCQGFSFENLTKLYLAGGFAQYINYRNAVKIGMLPDIAPERLEIIGNSSLAGAVQNAIDSTAMTRMIAVSREIDDIVLNTVPEFEYNYIDALLLP